MEGFTGVGGGLAEVMVDVVVDTDVVVNVRVPVVDVSFVLNTISVVYVDFKVSSMVVVKVSMLPGPYDSGVYRGGFSVLM